MLGLAAPLGFPLGGEGLSGGKPWIINLRPVGGEENVKLLRPVRFSARDAESFVLPADLLVEVGYAKVHSDGEELFDELPRTKRISLLPGIVGTEPDFDLVSGGMRLTRTLISPQPSVYATNVDAGSGFTSAMLTAIVTPETVSVATVSTSGPLNSSVYPGGSLPMPYSPVDVPISSGVVLGLHHGPRNKAVYLWFQKSDAGTKIIRLTGFLNYDLTTPSLNTSIPFNWSITRRYTLVWNEANGYFEVYTDVDSVTLQIFRIPLSSIPEMPTDYYIDCGSSGDVTGFYGQEGAIGDSSLWRNIAVTTDVGYPILGSVRTGYFRTRVESAYLFKTDGLRDPRDTDIGTWFDMPEELLADRDPDAATLVANGVFSMIKETEDKTFAIYREDPSLLRSNSDGFALHAVVSADNENLDSASTGTGFIIFDGQTVFQISLFNDFASKTVGILKRDGVPVDLNDSYIPETPIDWSVGGFRVVVDPRANEVRLYAAEELETPRRVLPLDRSLFPSAADYGWTDVTPFVAFGHIIPANTLGSFNVTHFEICHLFQSWEGATGVAPDDAPSDPAFDLFTYGSPTASMNDGALEISAPAGSLYRLSREIPFERFRGGATEARLRITSNRRDSHTGVRLILDDGVNAWSLTFVETAVGRFACLSLASGLGFTELAGKDGRAAEFSFEVDWTEFHTYRIEKQSYGGVQVFLDDEMGPRISHPDSLINEMPLTQYSGTPTLAFGQFSLEGAVAEWSFVRGYFSGGCEISFKKNKPDSVLREELFDTQAIVVAYALDNDI